VKEMRKCYPEILTYGQDEKRKMNSSNEEFYKGNITV
jgi:hypothetical protein